MAPGGALAPMSGASTPSRGSSCPVGFQEHPLGGKSRFDNHRFDNYSSWLDREERLKARRQGRPLGHGFSEPKPPPEPRPEKPFTVMEAAFTSGLMVQRQYNQHAGTLYKTEGERSDPYHYPNFLEVKDEMHYEDARRRSQNVDPREWKPDPKMASVVTDDMVKVQLSAHLGEARKYIDPKLMSGLFDEGVRPTARNLHELNADMSCLDLPKHEGGSATTRAAIRIGRGPTGPAGKPSGQWSWCLGPRQQLSFDRPINPAEAELVRSQSLPQMTLAQGNQPSMLAGNLGGSSTATFHGLHTRKFGGQEHLRMRGGTLAEARWAGTFPDLEARK